MSNTQILMIVIALLALGLAGPSITKSTHPAAVASPPSTAAASPAPVASDDASGASATCQCGPSCHCKDMLQAAYDDLLREHEALKARLPKAAPQPTVYRQPVYQNSCAGGACAPAGRFRIFRGR